MARHIAAGIDIGTSQVKVVIAEELRDGTKSELRVIGTGVSPTGGLSRGYITDAEEVARSVRTAVRQAEQSSGARIRRAYFAASGVGLACHTTSGSVVISRADLEVTDKDLETALSNAETALPPEAKANRRIINSVPIEYKIDGKVVWGRVEGLHAHKVEIKALFITALEHHLQDIIKTAEMAGLEVIDMVAGPAAASFVAMSKKHKKAGSILVDIGAETLSLVVYENDNLVSLEVIPLGSVELTHDIALGLKVPLEEAESIKRGTLTKSTFSKKRLDIILAHRLQDYFDHIENHLKKIGRDGLLPAGVVLTGGGAGIEEIRDFASDYLELHSEVAEIRFGHGNHLNPKDTIWTTACGLALAGLEERDDYVLGSSNAGFKKSLKRLSGRLREGISHLLP